MPRFAFVESSLRRRGQTFDNLTLFLAQLIEAPQARCSATRTHRITVVHVVDMINRTYQICDAAKESGDENRVPPPSHYHFVPTG
jgi:hypothetical protein